jgi:hypothetical protein
VVLVWGSVRFFLGGKRIRPGYLRWRPVNSTASLAIGHDTRGLGAVGSLVRHGDDLDLLAKHIVWLT